MNRLISFFFWKPKPISILLLFNRAFQQRVSPEMGRSSHMHLRAGSHGQSEGTVLRITWTEENHGISCQDSRKSGRDSNRTTQKCNLQTEKNSEPMDTFRNDCLRIYFCTQLGYHPTEVVAIGQT
jgi:hypothetical protein